MLVVVKAPDAVYSKHTCHRPTACDDLQVFFPERLLVFAVPNGWWHEVLTPSFSISVNTWFGSAKSATARLRPTKIYCFSEEYAAFVRERIRTAGEAAAGEEQEQLELGKIATEKGEERG